MRWADGRRGDLPAHRTGTSPWHSVAMVESAPPRALRVLLCPDGFKGSITAADAARAIAEGWHEERPDDHLDLLPLADGGEGTLDALAAATPGARVLEVEVTGPDGHARTAAALLLPDGTGVVELAETSGIALLGETLLPLDAHTVGLGEAITAVLDAGAERVLVAVGSSASTDGGTGVLSALGARFLDAEGRPVARGAAGLAAIERVDLTGLRSLPADGVRILSDVRAPLTGPRGAAAVFGPQKGLTPEDIPVVDGHLARLAALYEIDPGTPGAGAAGGTAAGLLAWGAELVAGSAEIGRTAGLPGRLARADVVITGEGRYDGQTSDGKVVGHVAELVAGLVAELDTEAPGGPRLAIVAGSIDAPLPPGAMGRSLVDITGSVAEAIAHPRPALAEAGRELARELGAPS